jgi:GTP cyclohydrolase IA
MRARPFGPGDVDLPTAAEAVDSLLKACGFEVSDGVNDTPMRVAKAYAELLSGYNVDIKALLATTFDASYDEVIVLRDVPFVSLCEHHLMTFEGVASLAYVPGEKAGKVVGLSKLARLVEAHARRLQIQERMTADIAHDLEQHLGAAGVAVIVQATHSCMTCRGVRKPGASMVTSSMLGVFRTKPEARAEVLALLR